VIRVSFVSLIAWFPLSCFIHLSLNSLSVLLVVYLSVVSEVLLIDSILFIIFLL
jgi:hypothetical protein